MTISSSLSDIFISLGLNVQGDKGRMLLSRVEADVSQGILSSVNYQASAQINSIPNQLIGPNNPVDLISSNLGPLDIRNNLQGTINTLIYNDIETLIINSIRTNINDIYGNTSRVAVNFNSILPAITVALSPIILSSIGDALDNFTRELFSGNNPVHQIVNNISSQFSSFGIGALDRIQSENVKNLANKHLGLAAQFDVNNESNLEKVIKGGEGYRDPESKYPTSEYSDTSDTNKLAQGDVEQTIVVDKNKDRMKGAILPGGMSFDQPESSYNAEYPHNKVIQTESGHIIEIDDTPGSERLHVYHKSGTFIEIDSVGNLVKRTKGSDYSVIDCNGKISIQGKADISINGACNIYIGNDANIEVGGDTNLVCHNDTSVSTGGKLNLSAKEEINLVSDVINLQATTIQDKSLNRMTYSKVSNSFHEEEFNVQSKKIDISSEEFKLFSKDNLHIKSESDILINPENDLHLRAGNDYLLDADDYYTDQNKSRRATTSKESLRAIDIPLGTMDGRKHSIPVEITDPVPVSKKDSYSLFIEEPGYSLEEYENTKTSIINSGIATSSEIVSNPEPLETFDGGSQQTMAITGDEDIRNRTSLPGNYQLSPHFTLASLSTDCAVSKYKINSRELSFGEIAFNLQNLALNVLEPIYGIYPKMIITSGYRSRESSSRTSQHPLGMAADIQFIGLPKSEYFDVAKELVRVLNYDQFILEYSSYANNPWIHISYSSKTNRKQVMTFYNHRKKGDGLLKLM